jgi:hypothetical protein
LDFPKISWRSEFWFALIPFVLSLILLAIPDLSRLGWYKKYGGLVATVLFVLPFLIPVTIWAVRSFAVMGKRIYRFPSLVAEIDKHREETRGIRQNISELLERISGQKIFDVSSASIGQNNSLYILLPKVKGVRLQKGNLIVVIDTNDGMAMGFFEIIQIRKSDYLAEGKSGIDALWLGFVKEQRNVNMLPYFAAVYVPQGGQYDK